MGTKKKLTKEDKKFLIQLNLSNRDFLVNTANIIITTSLSITALLFSITSILLAFSYSIKDESERIPIYVVAAILFLIGFAVWVFYGRKASKHIANSKKLNEQYQRHFDEVFPEDDYQELKKYYK